MAESHCGTTSGQVQTGQKVRDNYTVGQFKVFAAQLNTHATDSYSIGVPKVISKCQSMGCKQQASSPKKDQYSINVQLPHRVMM